MIYVMLTSTALLVLSVFILMRRIDNLEETLQIHYDFMIRNGESIQFLYDETRRLRLSAIFEKTEDKKELERFIKEIELRIAQIMENRTDDT